MNRKSRKSTATRAVAAAALLGALAVGTAAVALGASGPAAPTITSMPANPTSSTSASFVFSSPPAGGSNQCKLDSGSFGACTTSTTKTYSGLAAGSHTFQVQAVDNTGKTAATSFSWVIDTTAPSVGSITRVGASPTNTSSVAWAVTFSEGVTGVTLGSFSLNPTVAGASLSTLSGSGATYTVTANSGIADGTLTLRLSNGSGVKDLASNALGGPVPFVGQAYVIDRTPPAKPTITNAPDDPTPANFSDPSTFAFNGETGALFRCSIDGVTPTACTSPKGYSGLGQGAHSFSVVAVDAVGHVSTAATYTWTIVHPVKNFTITGNATAALYPGVWVPIAVTISNDNNYAIRLTGLTVTATGNSSPAGCPPNVGQGAAANLEFQQSNVSAENPLLVPGKGTATIPLAGAVSRPRVRLTNAAFNQNSCKNKSFTLTYQGLAGK